VRSHLLSPFLDFLGVSPTYSLCLRRRSWARRRRPPGHPRCRRAASDAPPFRVRRRHLSLPGGCVVPHRCSFTNPHHSSCLGPPPMTAPPPAPYIRWPRHGRARATPGARAGLGHFLARLGHRDRLGPSGTIGRRVCWTVVVGQMTTHIVHGVSKSDIHLDILEIHLKFINL
jgi:hypothetical protein